MVDNVEEGIAGEVEKEVEVVRVEDTEAEEVEKGEHLMVIGGARGVEVREDEEGETTTTSHLLPFEKKNIRDYCATHGIYADLSSLLFCVGLFLSWQKVCLCEIIDHF